MVFLVMGFIIGTIIGSLALCLAYRSLNSQSFWGRSYCDKCKRSLAWYDLFPILSYFSLNGRCRYCQQKLSLEYPITELIMGLLIALLFYLRLSHIDLSQLLAASAFDLSLVLLGLQTLFEIFVISILVMVLITDIKTGLIPDRITYPAISISFFYIIGLSLLKIGLLYHSLSTNAVGRYLLPPHSDYFYRHSLLIGQDLLTFILSGVGLGLFFLVLILITRGRGMGGGDLKLGIFMGLTLGFPNSVVALFLAFFLGSIIGILLILFRRKHFGQTIPFGPFLSIGSLLVIFFGQQILQLYLKTT